MNVALARILGVSQYGVFVIAVTLLTIVNLIQSQGVPQALSRIIADGSASPAAAWRAASLPIAGTLRLEAVA